MALSDNDKGRILEFFRENGVEFDISRMPSPFWLVDFIADNSKAQMFAEVKAFYATKRADLVSQKAALAAKKTETENALDSEISDIDTLDGNLK